MAPGAFALRIRQARPLALVDQYREQEARAAAARTAIVNPPYVLHRPDLGRAVAAVEPLFRELDCAIDGVEWDHVEARQHFLGLGIGAVYRARLALIQAHGDGARSRFWQASRSERELLASDDSALEGDLV